MELIVDEIKDKNCDCVRTAIADIEKFITESSDAEDGLIVSSSQWERSFMYPKRRLYAVLNIECTVKKKDGTRSKPLKKKYDLLFPYCPFCGQKYNDTQS